MCTRLEEAQAALLAENEENLRLERTLRNSEKLVAVGQVASRLAHEIGTPLNVIQMRAEQLLQRETQDDKDRAFLKVIVTQIERISGFIRQLLTLVRRPELEFRTVHVNDVVQRVADALGSRDNPQGRTVRVEPCDEDPVVQGDPDQLQQVVLNLTVNALQAMETTGHVTLSIRMRQNGNPTVEIAVADTGPGIQEESLGKIFDPFFTTKGANGGTGLGLAISREIVLSHHGAIVVESEPGKGSRFIVTLPAVNNLSVYKEGYANPRT
jgi:signal transduction histidine kinase